MIDPISERVRRTGGSMRRSVGHIVCIKRVTDNDIDHVDPLDLLAECRQDNQALSGSLR